jgi:hypothetical protein
MFVCCFVCLEVTMLHVVHVHDQVRAITSYYQIIHFDIYVILRFLEVCLRLWQRSKEGYREFSESGFIKLLSGN